MITSEKINRERKREIRKIWPIDRDNKDGLVGRDNKDRLTGRDNNDGLVVQKVGKIKIKREKAQNAKKGEIFKKLQGH